MSDSLDIVTLDEARQFLDFDDDDLDDDGELQSFVTAITSVVEGEVGPVVARAATAIVYGNGDYSVPAPSWPVLSVTSGTYLSDSSTVDVSKMVADNGMIFQSNGSAMPYRTWTMTYQEGRAEVPDGIKKGALEVLQLAWATQRTKDAPAFLIPYRAAAWFKPHARKLGFA